MFNKIGNKFTTPVVEQLQTAANSNLLEPKTLWFNSLHHSVINVGLCSDHIT